MNCTIYFCQNKTLPYIECWLYLRYSVKDADCSQCFFANLVLSICNPNFLKYGLLNSASNGNQFTDGRTWLTFASVERYNRADSIDTVDSVDFAAIKKITIII